MPFQPTKCLASVALSLVLATFAPAARADYMLNGQRINDEQAKAAGLVKEAITLLQNDEVAKAVAKAEDANSIAPNFYYVLGALGVCYARAGKYEEAIATLRKTLELKPDLPDTLWSLAATLQSAGRTEEATPLFKEFQEKYPHDPKATQATAFIALMDRNKHEGAVKHSDEDYFDEAVGKNVIRWQNDDLPVKIYIRKGDGVKGYKLEFDEMLHLAMKDWQTASGGKIQFKEVTSPQEASITVTWSDNPSDVSNPAEGGETLLRPVGSSLASASITVLTVKTGVGYNITDYLIRLICTHELGHALGIAGHSPSPKDIMYSSLPLDYEHAKLSARDGKTLQKLYSIDIATVAHDTLRSQSMLSTTDLQHSGDLVEINNKAMDAMKAHNFDEAVKVLDAGFTKYPSSQALKHNLGAALNNQGLEVMRNGDYKKALQIFQRAMTLAPEIKSAKTNIPVVHYNAGLAAATGGRFTEAEPDLKLAVELAEADGNTQLLSKAATEYVFVLKKNGKTEVAKTIETKYLPAK